MKKFREYIRANNLIEIKRLFNDLSTKKQQQMLYKAFTWAARYSDIKIVKLLLNIAPEEKQQKIIHAYKDRAFKNSIENGNIKILEFLFKLTSKEKQLEMILANNANAICYAAYKNHISTLKFLLESLPEGKKQEIIFPLENSDKKCTALMYQAYKNIEVLKLLCLMNPFHNKWFIPEFYDNKYHITTQIKPYLNLGIDLMALEKIALVSKNIFNNEKIRFKNSKTENLDNKKKIKLTNESIFEPIFTPDNEIILIIMEFLSGVNIDNKDSINQIKKYFTIIQETGGINTEFIKKYDLLTEEEKVKISGNVADSDPL